MFSPSDSRKNKLSIASSLGSAVEQELAALEQQSYSPPLNYNTFIDVDLTAAPLLGRTPSIPVFSPSAAVYNRQAQDLNLRAKQFIAGLESGALLQSVVGTLQDKLHHFNLTYPKQQTLAERIFCFVYERRLQCILTSSGTDVEKYFLLSGFVEDMQTFLCDLREQKHSIRELDFAGFQQDWFAWMQADVIKQRYLDASHYQENYRCFSRRKAAMANVHLNAFPDLEKEQFNAALSAILNAKKGHLEHYQAAQAIALRVLALVDNETTPDYKFHTLVLQQVYAVARKQPLVVSLAWLAKLADLVEGNTQSQTRLGQLLKHAGFYCCVRRSGLSKMLTGLVELATTSALEHAPVAAYR